MTIESKTTAVLQPPTSAPAGFTYRLHATIDDIVVIGMVPEGFRIDVHYSGQLDSGVSTLGLVRGIDYLLIRSDGTKVLDIRESITTPGGYQLAVRAKGYGEPGAQLAAPRGAGEITWPDAQTPLLGVAFCATPDPEFQWLNGAILTFSGIANLGARRLEATGRVLTPEMARATQ